MDPASLEQMNKLRKSLGLPPLNIPGASPAEASGPSFKKENASAEDENESGEQASTIDTREAAGYDNFKQLQDEEKKRIEREKRKAAIQKARDIAARNTRLEGRGLGDADEDLDAKAWLKGQKKRQKEIEAERAKKKAEELLEQERLAALQYTTEDLAGVQVAHGVGDFDDEVGEQILTLQDREIGDGDDDEDGDVLENADMVAKDKLKEKLDLKKKIAYDVHDTEAKELLAQYDDKKRKAFTLDASGSGSMAEEREAKRLQIGERLKDMVSLDILKSEPVSDYLEIKIKKPKKTKKNKRQKQVDDEDDVFPVSTANGADEMDVDSVATETKPKPKKSDVFNDDEDLANALSFTRRAALKKQKRKPEDIIRQLKQEEDSSPEQEAEQGITLDDTTTFLDNLAARPPEEQIQKVHKSIEKEQPESPEANSPDQEMTEVHAIDDNEEELLARLRREQSTHTPEVPNTGLDEEKSLDQGLGAALNLLKQRGLVKSADDHDKNKLYRDRQNFILQARLREHDTEQRARAQRERDRSSGKLSHMSVREREEHARWQNTQREHQSSVAAAAAFNKEYKPDVQIKYVDEDGRLMNQKEAFKQLSHQFHGKGSGKGKTEKHLKKVDEERRREARSVLDAGSEVGRGYEGAAQHQRKGGEAGVRLQ